MQFKIQTQIQINAQAEKVWNVLTNTANYPKWNPFVKSLEGKLAKGEKIKVVLDGMTFKPTIQHFEPHKKFSWLGLLFIKGLFDGHHQFELIDNGDGTTTFLHSEDFKGLLVGLLKNKLQTETKAGFEKMNEALKREVEK